ncbi:polymorphic toxin-type HINT domain-containing protein [Macrococcus capreoli]|uniref:polymorphic toxin-type HINT domain-containing protein n=1 Tax=Macrococcus capreoli TaxID=2982690 RepID=UPI0021D5A168|nr:polymorphic toxin-type HINT domain-containing protein [Macrococcus sp. TMW 2.2395]MCU7557213.1 polymorphic toxin-type HINT domain-containing protein [Macrococcus sp. TMW 2.2395]
MRSIDYLSHDYDNERRKIQSILDAVSGSDFQKIDDAIQEIQSAINAYDVDHVCHVEAKEIGLTGKKVMDYYQYEMLDYVSQIDHRLKERVDDPFTTKLDQVMESISNININAFHIKKNGVDTPSLHDSSAHVVKEKVKNAEKEDVYTLEELLKSDKNIQKIIDQNYAQLKKQKENKDLKRTDFQNMVLKGQSFDYESYEEEAKRLEAERQAELKREAQESKEFWFEMKATAGIIVLSIINPLAGAAAAAAYSAYSVHNAVSGRNLVSGRKLSNLERGVEAASLIPVPPALKGAGKKLLMKSIEKTGLKASTKVITSGMARHLKMPEHLITLKSNFAERLNQARIQGLVDQINGHTVVNQSREWVSKSNQFVKQAVEHTFDKSFGLDSFLKPKMSGDHVLNQIVKNTNIQRLPSVLSQKVIPYRVVKDRVMHDISHVKKTIARPVEQFRKHYEPAFNQFIDNVSSGTKRAFNNLEYTKLVGEHLHVKMFDKPVFRLTREELGIILRSRMTDVKAKLCEFNLIKNCFLAGTLVQTKFGLKPIETIQVGDEVLSRCMETGYVSYKSVTETFSKQADVITTITLTNGETIQSTPHHLYFTTNRGFIVAEQLTDGDKLLGEHNILSISSVETTEKTTQVYNFEVADNHTYFVGTAGVLVHNKCRIVFKELEDGTIKITPKGFKDAESYLDYMSRNKSFMDFEGYKDLTEASGTIKHLKNYLEETEKPVLINQRYANGYHKKTGLRYNCIAAPRFKPEDIKFEFKLEDADWTISDSRQFKKATEELYDKILQDKDLVKRFTSEQIEAIENGAEKIPGLTWHHSDKPGKLELVPEELHKKSGHLGGRATWGNGNR